MELDAELMAVTPRRATVANRDATNRHVDPWMPEASLGRNGPKSVLVATAKAAAPALA